MALTTLRARHGGAFRVPAMDSIRIINTHGSQVVDTWAISSVDPDERLSMEHTRAVLQKLAPEAGDRLYSNRRRVMAVLTEDTSPGVHDTLIASCDQTRYAQLGHDGYHDNCHDNYLRALRDVDIDAGTVPCPLNLFMNVPVGDGRRLSFDAPVSQPGQWVTLRAEMDVFFVLSACPQDLVPVNGLAQSPTDVDVDVMAAPNTGSRDNA